MENHKLVLPEHLNHFGFLFGGHMLAWVDEVAWIAASLQHPGAQLVTVGMDKVEFRRGVREGTILKFHVGQTRLGETSVTYGVEVTRARVTDTSDREPVFSTRVTFVSVDDAGEKVPIARRAPPPDGD